VTRLTRALDGLFALRPLLLIPAVALYGAGSAWARVPTDAAALGALLLLLGSVHAANAWRDREGDLLNRKGLPVTSGLVGRRALLLGGLACLAGALLLAARLPTWHRWLLLGTLALGAAYVAPPFELKRRAGLDLLSHGIGYGVVAFLLGAGGSVGTAPRALAASLPYALGVLTVSLLTMMADEPGDREVGQRTSAVRLGRSGAARLLTALSWATAGAGLLALEAAPALWGVTACAMLAPGAPRDAASSTVAAIRLQLLFVALLAIRNPMPLVFALATGAAAAFYFRIRWGVAYPVGALGRPVAAG